MNEADVLKAIPPVLREWIYARVIRRLGFNPEDLYMAINPMRDATGDLDEGTRHMGGRARRDRRGLQTELMTSTQLKRLRETIGVDPFAWSAVLGVHVSTVYRWESSGRALTMDPIQRDIVARLRDLIADQPRLVGKLNKTIVDGLVRGGSLYALRNVLTIIIEEE